MNWAELIKQIKKHGFTGDGESFTAVQAYLDEHFGGNVKMGNAEVDVEALYQRHIVKMDAEVFAATGVHIGEDFSKKRGGDQSRIHTANQAAHNKGGLDLSDKALAERGWRKHKTYKPQDMDNLDDGGFRDMADFCRSIAGSTKGKFDKRLAEGFDTKAGQFERSGAEGGFLVPERMAAEVLQSADNIAPWLASRARFDTDSDNLRFPVVADRDRSDGEIGGLALSRMAEGGNMTSDTLNLESLLLKPRKAGLLVEATNELMEDSTIGMGQVLNQQFGRCVALTTSDEYLNGTGAGQPLGLLASNGTYSQAKTGGQAGDTVTYANVQAMYSRLDQNVRSGAVWIAHIGVFPQLAEMVTGAAGQEAPVWLANAQAVPQSLFGLNIYFHESCRLLGDLGDIWLVQPNRYVYVQRRLAVDVSTHAAFSSDKTTFRLTLRDDGAPMARQTLDDLRGYEVADNVNLAART